MTSSEPSDDDAIEATEPAGSDKKRTLIRIVKLAIVVVVVVGLALAARSAIVQWRTENDKIQSEIIQIDQRLESLAEPSQAEGLRARRQALLRSRPNLSNLDWLRIAIAALLYTIGLLIPGLVLHSALRSLAERPRLSTAIASQLIGHAGKYVPGKAMVIVLRAGGLSVDKVNPVRATISVFMETLLMMGVGAAVAGAVVWCLDIPDWMKWSALGVAAFASVPTLPPILKVVAAKVSNTTSDPSNEDSEKSNSISSLRFYLTGWSWSIFSWAFIGASFTFLVSAIPSATPTVDVISSGFVSLAAVSTAAIALAMVVGFVSLIPGGAGVRELVLTTVLATAISPVQALLGAIAARILFIVVESVCASVAWHWLSRQRDSK